MNHPNTPYHPCNPNNPNNPHNHHNLHQPARYRTRCCAIMTSSFSEAASRCWLLLITPTPLPFSSSSSESFSSPHFSLLPPHPSFSPHHHASQVKEGGRNQQLDTEFIYRYQSIQSSLARPHSTSSHASHASNGATAIASKIKGDASWAAEMAAAAVRDKQEMQLFRRALHSVNYTALTTQR